jgi:hypothetical protein
MTIRRWDDAKKTDNPAMNTHVHAAATPPSTHDTTRIDDLRIGAVRPLINPALLQECACRCATTRSNSSSAAEPSHRRRAAWRATTG